MFQDDSQINLMVKLQNSMVNQNKETIISVNPKAIGFDGDCVHAPDNGLLALSPNAVDFDGNCAPDPAPQIP